VVKGTLTSGCQILELRHMRRPKGSSNKADTGDRTKLRSFVTVKLLAC